MDTQLAGEKANRIYSKILQEDKDFQSSLTKKKDFERSCKDPSIQFNSIYKIKE